MNTDLKEKDPKNSLYVRVIETALKYPEGFTYSDIINNEGLNLKDWEKSIITRHFEDACQHYNYKDSTKGETIFLFIIGNHQKSNSEENKYLLTFEAEFTFIDFQELKFARENAREARKYAVVAIIISLLALAASVVTPFWIAKNINQTVEISNTQLHEIIDSKK